MGAATMENSMESPQKIKQETTHDPAIPLLDLYPKELKTGTWTDICTPYVNSSIIHNSQKVEATQMSINGGVDKQNVVCTYNRIFTLKEEGTSDTCNNTDKPWGRYSKWNKPSTKGQLLYDFTYVR